MNIPAGDNLHLREEGAGVRIPLEHNLNDKGSLFAGSTYAGAILAAYRAAEQIFAERGLAGDLVAKTASISYLRRIASDGTAVASVCGGPLFKANGNRALAVTVTVLDDARVPCAELSVEFILLKERNELAPAPLAPPPIRNHG